MSMDGLYVHGSRRCIGGWPSRTARPKAIDLETAMLGCDCRVDLAASRLDKVEGEMSRSTARLLVVLRRPVSRSRHVDMMQQKP